MLHWAMCFSGRCGAKARWNHMYALRYEVAARHCTHISKVSGLLLAVVK